MSWIFGAGIGLMMGGPLGAIAGGVMQHLATKDTSYELDNSPYRSPQDAQEAVFITNLAAIMTKVAMADSQISQQERRVIHNFFASKLGYRGEELKYIDGIIAETERVNPDLWKICQAFSQHSTIEMRLLLLDMTYQIALADQVITDNEQIEIDIIAAQIGISEGDHNRIKLKYSSSNRMDHYHTLGIDRSASNEEIKKAYKQMVMQYHPDKVSHLGKELIDFANKKFKEISSAYETLRKERGF